MRRGKLNNISIKLVVLIAFFTLTSFVFDQLVIQNTAGNGLKNAHGVSIYFPEYRISGSYLQSNFGSN